MGVGTHPHAETRATIPPNDGSSIPTWSPTRTCSRRMRSMPSSAPLTTAVARAGISSASNSAAANGRSGSLVGAYSTWPPCSVLRAGSKGGRSAGSGFPLARSTVPSATASDTGVGRDGRAATRVPRRPNPLASPLERSSR